MAKLNSQNFTVEGFKDQSTWIGKLFSPLNSFITQVYSAFQNQLTIADNLYMEIYNLKFVNEVSYFPINFAIKFKKHPEMVLIGQLIDEDGNTSNVAPLLSWEYSEGNLSISAISGLTASKTYNVKLLIIYG